MNKQSIIITAVLSTLACTGVYLTMAPSTPQTEAKPSFDAVSSRAVSSRDDTAINRTTKSAAMKYAVSPATQAAVTDLKQDTNDSELELSPEYWVQQAKIERANLAALALANGELPSADQPSSSNLGSSSIVADQIRSADTVQQESNLNSETELNSDKAIDSAFSNQDQASFASASVTPNFSSKTTRSFAAKSEPIAASLAVANTTQAITLEANVGVQENRAVNEHIADSRPIVRALPEPTRPIATPDSKIKITSPLGSSYTNAANAVITGTVELERNLDSVTINGQSVNWSTGEFTANISLTEGFNPVIATADYGRRIHNNSIGITLDTLSPSVTSAVSATNSIVMLQFSEPMQDDVLLATSNFNIVNTTTLTRLPVLEASFADTSKTVVQLQTASQSSTTYTLTVANVKDRAGNTILRPQPFLIDNPAAVDFIGTSPSGEELKDFDEDTLPDHVELSGWVVVVKQVNGVNTNYFVYSDPYLADTDGDGVRDDDEYHGSMNPRSHDTDGDTLSDDAEWNSIYSDPSSQDTDGDGIEDGFEFKFFKTSPILADTDGDQISDPDEILAGNRNPLIADLPSPRIKVGNINMQLDTRFTYTNEQGEVQTESKTVEATLSKSENETFSSSNETSNKNTIAASQEVSATASSGAGGDGSAPSPFPSYSATATVGSTQGSERGSTVSVGEESARAAEEAYHDSLTSSVERDIRESITREVVDATIKVDLTIENDGDIPFSISNLELTAQTQNPNNRRQIIPVAALVPENENLGSINIGALGDPSRGPFVFKTASIFPQQVEELMKSPRGFLVQLANFDITDQEGNNFAFTSQAVLDRTVGITFDEGLGKAKSYRVATASFQNPITGKPNGITMARALEIIGLSRYPTIRDGGNGVVETTALSSDDQHVSLEIFRPVEPTGIIIQAGADGSIETTPGGDDIVVPASYETALHIPAAYIKDGGNGIAETTVAASDESLAGLNTAVQAEQGIVRAGLDGTIESTPGGDDILVPAGIEKEVLIRYLDTSAEPNKKRFWALFATQERAGVDLDEYQIRSGEQFDFAYVQDQDEDGVWAREEYLHGSSDLLTNTDGCNLVPAPEPCDTLLDSTEIQDGWRVQLKSSPQGYNVFSNPNQADSDRDLLLDHEEFACELDPRLRDTDLDGLTDWEELNGMRIVDGDAVPMVSRDAVTNEVTYEIQPYSGLNAPLVPHESNQKCDDILAVPGFATDPLNADTDGDLVNDLLELSLGLNPNDSSDGPLFLDDDEDGVPNKIEVDGIIVTINGVATRVYSNPQDTDSDDDGLPDLLEHFIKSNPSDPDTDGDTLPDASEYKAGGNACITQTPGVLCTRFGDLIIDSFSTFISDCDAAGMCNNETIEAGLLSRSSPQHGTNLSERDSDFDGLTDADEITGTSIVVNGATLMVTSLPLDPNSDSDAFTDQVERLLGTNPLEDDTDSDGTRDHVEQDLGRDPLNKDILVTVKSGDISVTGFGDLAFYVYVNGVHLSSCDQLEVGVDDSSVSNPCTYMLRRRFTQAGSDEVEVKLYASEVDDDFDGKLTQTGNDDYCTTITETFSYTENSDGRDIDLTFSGDCTSDITPSLTLRVTIE